MKIQVQTYLVRKSSLVVIGGGEGKVEGGRRVRGIIVSDDDIAGGRILGEYTGRCLLLGFLQAIDLFAQHNMMFCGVMSNYKFQ